mmetsp:Transcript_8773/g.32458  ORF Transcript_8773/g.32458 Transcript_8773/m.32458 type:complete len:809 (-) Transcript_8773:123-2549(-)
MTHSHKAGAKKQQNKKHSTAHSSKRSLKRQAKGRVESYYDQSGTKKRRHISLKAAVVDKKHERKDRAKQMRKNKREEILQKKRFGKKDAPTKIVGLLSFSEIASPEADYSQKVRKLMVDSPDVTLLPSQPNYNLQNYQFNDFQNCRVSLFNVNDRKNPKAVLDAGKMVNVLVLVIEADEGMDDWSTNIVRLIKSQGTPSIILALTGLDKIPVKKQKEYKKEYAAFIKEEFAQDIRVVPCDTEADGRMLRRWIVEQTSQPIHWREARPYIVPTHVSFATKGSETGTLVLEGFVRGKKLCANQLIHIVNQGTYQISKIEIPEVQEYTPRDEVREQLKSDKEPDVMGQEQPWITVDDVENEKKKLIRVPKGMSSYQAAWLGDDYESGEEGEDDSDEDNFSEDQDMADDQSEEDGLMQDFEERLASNNGTNTEDAKTTVDKFFNIDDDEDMDDMEREAERQLYLEQMKEMREETNNEREFVDTPTDAPARVRFQKYRGLKSMRSSPWDPKENLPIDYSRIYQFKDFKRSKKVATKYLCYTQDELIEEDTFVRIYVQDVPLEIEKSHNMSFDTPMMALALYRHEQKCSVVHLKVRKLLGVQTPVKSKDEVLVQIGCRWFKCNPILSEYNPRNPKKIRTEQYMRGGSKDDSSNKSAVNLSHTATIYAPITYKPAPVLMFKKDAMTGRMEFVAYGSVMDPEPDLVLLKRIVLTADIHRCHKRQAVLRFMFHNADDVRWFKPVELHSEQGRHGVIKEPIGTHGYMKCIFDDTLRQNDTVMMTLYKRVFPKWSTEAVDQLRKPVDDSSSVKEAKMIL